MATIQKQLIGKHNLIGDALGTTDYIFSVPETPQGTSLRNGIDNQVIEEVYISVDTALGDVNVYLPSIASFNLAWNAKIYIICTNAANACNIYPYNNEVVVNTINGFNSLSLSIPYDAYYLHIIEENTWLSLYCAGPLL